MCRVRQGTKEESFLPEVLERVDDECQKKLPKGSNLTEFLTDEEHRVGKGVSAEARMPGTACCAEAALGSGSHGLSGGEWRRKPGREVWACSCYSTAWSVQIAQLKPGGDRAQNQTSGHPEPPGTTTLKPLVREVSQAHK